MKTSNRRVDSKMIGQANLPVQLEELLKNVLDSKMPIHQRMNYRNRLSLMKDLIDKVIADFDTEYNFTRKS